MKPKATIIKSINLAEAARLVTDWINRRDNIDLKWPIIFNKVNKAVIIKKDGAE